MWPFVMVAMDLNSWPHACTASTELPPHPPAPDDAFDNTKENVFLSFLLSHDPRAILELTFKRISFKPCHKIHNIMDICFNFMNLYKRML